MPSIPALPAAAPSFAERLSTESHSRPHTAPTQPIAISKRSMPFSEASAAFTTAPQTSYTRTFVSSTQLSRDERLLERPLAPPLPLVLRPPLRKKKSFSRVSDWLFPAEHERNASLGSVTNLPRPVADGEGFMHRSRGMTRTSVDTVSSTSSWETEEEGQTVPTTAWSPREQPCDQTRDTQANTQADTNRHADGREEGDVRTDGCFYQSSDAANKCRGCFLIPSQEDRVAVFFTFVLYSAFAFDFIDTPVSTRAGTWADKRGKGGGNLLIYLC